jgi:hypothetical protein
MALGNTTGLDDIPEFGEGVTVGAPPTTITSFDDIPEFGEDVEVKIPEVAPIEVPKVETIKGRPVVKKEAFDLDLQYKKKKPVIDPYDAVAEEKYKTEGAAYYDRLKGEVVALEGKVNQVTDDYSNIDWEKYSSQMEVDKEVGARREQDEFALEAKKKEFAKAKRLHDGVLSKESIVEAENKAENMPRGEDDALDARTGQPAIVQQRVDPKEVELNFMSKTNPTQALVLRDKIAQGKATELDLSKLEAQGLSRMINVNANELQVEAEQKKPLIEEAEFINANLKKYQELIHPLDEQQKADYDANLAIYKKGLADTEPLRKEIGAFEQIAKANDGLTEQQLADYQQLFSKYEEATASLKPAIEKLQFYDKAQGGLTPEQQADFDAQRARLEEIAPQLIPLSDKYKKIQDLQGELATGSMSKKALAIADAQTKRAQAVDDWYKEQNRNWFDQARYNSRNAVEGTLARFASSILSLPRTIAAHANNIPLMGGIGYKYDATDALADFATSMTEYMDGFAPSNLGQEFAQDYAMINGLKVVIKNGEVESVRDADGFLVRDPFAIAKATQDYEEKKPTLKTEHNVGAGAYHAANAIMDMGVTLFPIGSLVGKWAKGLGAADKVADAAGIYAGSFILIHKTAYEDGLAAGLSPELASFYAHGMAAIETATETLNPLEMKLIRKLRGGSSASRLGAEEFARRYVAGASKTSALVYGLGQVAKNMGMEGLEGMGARYLGDKLDESLNVLAASDFDVKSTTNEYLGDFVVSAATGLAFSPIVIAGSRSDLERQTLSMLVESPDDAVKYIDALVGKTVLNNKGEKLVFTQEQADAVKLDMKNLTERVNSIKDISNLDDEKKIAVTSLVQSKMALERELAKPNLDDIAKKKYKALIESANKQLELLAAWKAGDSYITINNEVISEADFKTKMTPEFVKQAAFGSVSVVIGDNPVLQEEFRKQFDEARKSFAYVAGENDSVDKLHSFYTEQLKAEKTPYTRKQLQRQLKQIEDSPIAFYENRLATLEPNKVLLSYLYKDIIADLRAKKGIPLTAAQAAAQATTKAEADKRAAELEAYAKELQAITDIYDTDWEGKTEDEINGLYAEKDRVRKKEKEIFDEYATTEQKAELKKKTKKGFLELFLTKENKSRADWDRHATETNFISDVVDEILGVEERSNEPKDALLEEHQDVVRQVIKLQTELLDKGVQFKDSPEWVELTEKLKTIEDAISKPSTEKVGADPAGNKTVGKKDGSEVVKGDGKEAPAEKGEEEKIDEARVARRMKNEDILTAEGSTFYADIDLRKAKIGDEIHYESYKDGQWTKHKTKVKDIVDGKVIFENGQTSDDVSSYMNITAEDAWFAKNLPEAESLPTLKPKTNEKTDETTSQTDTTKQTGSATQTGEPSQTQTRAVNDASETKDTDTRKAKEEEIADDVNALFGVDVKFNPDGTYEITGEGDIEGARTFVGESTKEIKKPEPKGTLEGQHEAIVKRQGEIFEKAKTDAEARAEYNSLNKKKQAIERQLFQEKKKNPFKEGSAKFKEFERVMEEFHNNSRPLLRKVFDFIEQFGELTFEGNRWLDLINTAFGNVEALKPILNTVRQLSAQLTYTNEGSSAMVDRMVQSEYWKKALKGVYRSKDINAAKMKKRLGSAVLNGIKGFAGYTEALHEDYKKYKEYEKRGFLKGIPKPDEAPVKEQPKEPLSEARQFGVDFANAGLVETREIGGRGNEHQRLDLRMSNDEKIRAIKDIKDGNYDTTAAKMMLDRIEQMYNEGALGYVMGSGGSTQQAGVVPIEDAKKHIEDIKQGKPTEEASKPTEDEPFHNATAESIPEEIHTAIVDRIKNALSQAFGTAVHIVKDAKELMKAANKEPLFHTKDGNPIGFNYDTDQVARERFDLSKLKQIGKGSDRTVFDLGNGKVLKVAHSARGLEQNIYEGDGYLAGDVIPKVHERGLNYVVTDNAPRLKAADIVPVYDWNSGEEVGTERAGDMMKELAKFDQKDFDEHNADLEAVLAKYGFTDIFSYDVMYNDFAAMRNWGYKDGVPLHIDGGTFGGVEKVLNAYRGKTSMQDADFRAIYYKSRAIKKGNKETDKFTKFQVAETTPFKRRSASPSRLMIPNVRGKWTKEKILRYFKGFGRTDVKSTYGIAEYISEFETEEDFANHIYYHGTANGIDGGLRPSAVMSERQAEQRGGGGYGQRYWGVSLTKRKRTAESFSGMSRGVSIYPVLLKRDAKVIERTDIQDASEIEDIITELYEQGVDAVWIGGGEQELILVNPAAAILYKKGSEYHSVYGGFKSKPLTNEDIHNLYEEAKRVYAENKPKLKAAKTAEERNSVSSSIKPLTFQDKKGVPLGFADRNGDIWLNGEKINGNTPVHEAGHLWQRWAAEHAPHLLKAGLDKISRSPYLAQVRNNKFYIDQADKKGLKGKEREDFFRNEALAMAIGDKGEQFVTEAKKADFKAWLSELWKAVAEFAGLSEKTAAQIENMTMDEFAKAVAADLLSGKPLKGKVEGKKAGVDFDMQAATEQAGEIKLKYKGGVHLAPNGQASNLTEQQAKIVRTKAFKNWFGDWENSPETASKVVDKNGEPMVVYHGGAENITEFDERYAGDTTGNNDYGAFFFSSKEQVAEDYSRQALIRRYQDRSEEELADYSELTPEYVAAILDNIHDWAEERIKVVPSFLNIRNPSVRDYKGDGLDIKETQERINFVKNGVDYWGYSDEMGYEYNPSDIEDYREQIEARAREDNGLDADEEIPKRLFDQATQEVMDDNNIYPDAQEMDGVILKNTIDDIGDASNVIQDEFIAINPNQVKLADGSNTTFSPYDNDIRFAVKDKNQLDLFKRNAKAAAAKIREGKLHKKGQLSAASPISLAIDAAIEAVALTTELTGALAELLDMALIELRNSDAYKSRKSQLARDTAEAQLKAKLKERISSAKATAREEEPKEKKHKLPVRVIASPDVPDEIKQGVLDKGITYVEETRAMTDAAAKGLIDAYAAQGDLDAVLDYVANPSNKIDMPIRVALEQAIYVSFAEKAAEATRNGDLEDAETNRRKAVDVLHLAQKTGLEAGRAVNKQKDWARLTDADPEALVFDVQSQFNEKNKPVLDKHNETIKAAQEKLRELLESEEGKDLFKAKVEEKVAAEMNRPVRKSNIEMAMDALDKAHIKLRSMNFVDVSGVTVAMVDGAFAAAKVTLRTTQSVLEAVETAVKYVKEELAKAGITDWEKEGVFRQAVEESLTADGIRVPKKKTPKQQKVQQKKDVAQGLRDQLASIDALIKDPVKALEELEAKKKKAEERVAANESKSEEIKALENEIAIRKKLLSLVQGMEGITDAQKKEILSDALDSIIKNGYLSEPAFRQMFAKALGLDTLTAKDEQIIRKGAAVIQNVSAAQRRYLADLTPENLSAYRKAVREGRLANEVMSRYFRARAILGGLLSTFIRGNLLSTTTVVLSGVSNVATSPVRWMNNAISSSLDFLRYQLSRIAWLSRNVKYLENKRFNDFFANQREYYKGLPEGLKEGILQLWSGSIPDEVFEREMKGGLHPLEALMRVYNHASQKEKQKIMESVIDSMEATLGVAPELIFRLLNVTDKPFRTASSKAALGELVKLELANLKKELLNKPTLTQQEAELLRDIRSGKEYQRRMIEPSEAISEKAGEEGSAGVFQNKSLLLAAIEGASKAIAAEHKKKYGEDIENPSLFGAILKSIGKVATATTFPFINMPANWVEQTILYTNPLIAFGFGAVHARLGNVREANKLFATGVIGLMLSQAALWIIANGIARGSAGDDDDDERQKAFARGGYKKINWSLFQRQFTGGSKNWEEGDVVMEFYQMGLMGSVLLSYVDLYKNYGEEMAEQNNIAADLITKGFYKFGSSVTTGLDMPMVQGTNMMLNALSSGDEKAFDKVMIQTSNALKAVYLPSTYVKGQKALDKDAFLKNVKDDDWWQQFKNSYKYQMGNGEDLPNKHTSWGEPILKTPSDRNAWVYNLLDITKASKIPESTFGLELYNLHDRLKKENSELANGVLPPVLGKSITVNKVTHKLSEEEYETCLQFVGQRRKEIVSRYIENGINDMMFSTDSDEQRVKNLTDLYAIAAEVGRAQFVEKMGWNVEEEIEEDELDEIGVTEDDFTEDDFTEPPPPIIRKRMNYFDTKNL